MIRPEKTSQLKNFLMSHKIGLNKFFNQDLAVMVGLVFLFLGVAYYLAGVNDLIVKGYELKRLKKEVSRISEENKDFENKITSMESYSEISKRVRDLNMVKADKIDYIMVSTDVLARK